MSKPKGKYDGFQVIKEKHLATAMFSKLNLTARDNGWGAFWGFYKYRDSFDGYDLFFSNIKSWLWFIRRVFISLHEKSIRWWKLNPRCRPIRACAHASHNDTKTWIKKKNNKCQQLHACWKLNSWTSEWENVDFR